MIPYKIVKINPCNSKPNVLCLYGCNMTPGQQIINNSTVHPNKNKDFIIYWYYIKLKQLNYSMKTK